MQTWKIAGDVGVDTHTGGTFICDDFDFHGFPRRQYMMFYDLGRCSVSSPETATSAPWSPAGSSALLHLCGEDGIHIRWIIGLEVYLVFRNLIDDGLLGIHVFDKDTGGMVFIIPALDEVFEVQTVAVGKFLLECCKRGLRKRVAAKEVFQESCELLLRNLGVDIVL